MGKGKGGGDDKMGGTKDKSKNDSVFDFKPDKKTDSNKNLKSVIDKMKDSGIKPAPYQESRESRFKKRQEEEEKLREEQNQATSAKKKKIETEDEKIMRIKREKKAEKRRVEEKLMKQKEVDGLFSVGDNNKFKDKGKDKVKELENSSRKSSREEKDKKKKKLMQIDGKEIEGLAGAKISPLVENENNKLVRTNSQASS